jgi:hypothetical protein
MPKCECNQKEQDLETFKSKEGKKYTKCHNCGNLYFPSKSRNSSQSSNRSSKKRKREEEEENDSETEEGEISPKKQETTKEEYLLREILENLKKIDEIKENYMKESLLFLRESRDYLAGIYWEEKPTHKK